MGRIINGIIFESDNSNIENSPITEAIIQKQEKQRLIRRITEELVREITIEGIPKQQIEKSMRKTVDDVTKILEKEFQKHGGTVSR